MSHPVDRLKELLFESETRALSEVQLRLSKSESDRADEARERRAISDRLDSVFNRAGTEERFRGAVAQVLDAALRRAELERHAELSDAIAPLIVRTIRTEIVNSRDEMVEALYPITGRMVKAYVASAISDLAAQINRRVDSNPVMLRLRSLLTGKSMADLALSEGNGPEIKDAYLIRRGTGELVAHWAQAGGTNAQHAMSGVLAAITEFASDALGGEASALRQIDVGDSRIYLRASPIYILAARCTGQAPASAEQLIDDTFLQVIETVQEARTETSAPSHQTLLRGVSEQLEGGLRSLASNQRRSQVSPTAVLVALISLILLGAGAWIALDRYLVARAHELAETAIAATPGTKGYLVEIDVGPLGRRMALTGLTPDESVKAEILRRVQQGLPGTTIKDRLTPLPGAHGEIGLAIENASVTASLQRTGGRLDQVLSDLPKVVQLLERPGQREAAEKAIATATDAASRLRDPGRAPTRSEQAEVGEQLRRHTGVLAAMGLGNNLPPAPATASAAPSGAIETALQLELAADRLSMVTAAMLQAAAVRTNLPKPPPSIVRAPDITAFERLAIWMRSHAVFFGDELTFRDEQRAGATLDDLAKLMRETEALVRIVGYTDAKGTSDRNNALSENRARKVAEALIARGVPATRLSVVGRHDSNRIAAAIGEASPNRRVEFELAFDGEGQP